MGFKKGFDIASFEELEENTSKKPRKNKIGELFDWIDTVVIALLSVVIIFSLFFRWSSVILDLRLWQKRKDK